MIIYQGTKSGFLQDTDNRDIEDVVSRAYLATTGKYVPDAEIRSWRESLGQMAKVLRDDGMPDDMGVGIEYGIPQTSKRIDFILSGRDLDNRPHLIVVELKQWSSSKLTDKDGIVIAQRGGAHEREGAHPCYQEWSYAALLEGFNEAVYDGDVGLRPCAYLHNYIDDGVISHPHYAPYIEKAPLFLRGTTSASACVPSSRSTSSVATAPTSSTRSRTAASDRPRCWQTASPRCSRATMNSF